MYKRKIFGKLVKLSDDQFKKLKQRFNPRNFKNLYGVPVSKFIRQNETSCVLCASYVKKDCTGCTFKKFQDEGNVGCVTLIKKIIKKDNLINENILISHVRIITYSKEAHEDIKKVYDKLLKFRRVDENV